MGTSFTQSGNRGLVTLDGEVTLPHAEDLRRALIKALIDTDDISIALDGMQDVDLSCLQLLCSAHRSAARLKKRIYFAGDPPQLFKDMMTAAGFTRSTGCKLDCDKSCLWVGKGAGNVG
ncbi:MAG: hypothetical protein A2010_08605 [Nitrospirae bacterium GWD2_57_9]|nr:MAG: hypothetical protein A2010_08605 [Nitrospirae bacterium GWD2_57_9]OGW49102.1 MAG: hypothetical protein A2078_02445 [Nitrospirae bacterium GWC2_57_9]